MGYIYTVEELFEDVVVGYMGGGPTDGIYVGVRYDSEFGYPVSIEALWETEGGRAEIADEEEIRVRSLQP